MRNAKILSFIVVAFIAGTITSSTLAAADSNAQGQPFQALQSAIQTLQNQVNNLQTQLNKIQLTPGPTGATGPQGPAGKNGINGTNGAQGPPGIISAQSCPSGKVATGIDSNGNLICSQLANPRTPTTTSVSGAETSTPGLFLISIQVTGTAPTGAAYVSGPAGLVFVNGSNCVLLPVNSTTSGCGVEIAAGNPIGSGPITALYSGDVNNLPSTGAVQP